jgi:hypothetical protein
MNQSIVPEKTHATSMADPRVGWFTMDQIDYGSNELKSDSKTYIRRWKLKILSLMQRGTGRTHKTDCLLFGSCHT